MASTPVEQTLSSTYSAGGLTLDVDTDDTFTLHHDQPRSDDARHPFVLYLPEIAALLAFFDTPRGRRIQELARDAERDQHAPTTGVAHRFRNGDLYNQMNALVAVLEVVQAANDRLERSVDVVDLRNIVGNIMTALSMAGVELDDPRFVAGAFWYDLLQNEGAQAIGMLLRLHALADHPDACVAMVRHLAEKLEQGLFTDKEFAFGEV